jgi:hypothetical protein
MELPLPSGISVGQIDLYFDCFFNSSKIRGGQAVDPICQTQPAGSAGSHSCCSLSPVPENLCPEKLHQGLLPDSLLGLMRDQGFRGPVQEGHLVFHGSPVGIVQVPGERQAEQKAWRKKALIVVDGDPMNMWVGRIGEHPG